MPMRRLTAVEQCLIGVFAALAVASAQALDVTTLNTLLQRSAADSRAFVETQYRRVLQRPVETRGELRFTPPDVFEKHILLPREQTFRITADTLFIDVPGKATRQFSIRNQPLLAGLMRGFQALVAGQLQTLEPYYHLQLQGNETAWNLTLAPHDAALARHIRSIAVSGHAGELMRIEVTETSGDHSVTTLSAATDRK